MLGATVAKVLGAITTERIKMAKKAELLEELKGLDKKTKLTLRNTIAEITAAIAEVKVCEPVKAEEEPAEEKPEEEAVYAKSGKRSKKHEDEVLAKQTKDDKKADEEPEIKKGPKPIARPKIERRGKNYQKVAKKIDSSKLYTLKEAVQLATETCPVKFDSTVEVHVRLNVDPRQADQNIRAVIALPSGTGKTVRVAVFAPDSDAKAALEAGADIAGDEDFLRLLDKGNIDFDTLISTPAYMPKLGKYARLLGPKGLMPNPKAGTVSSNVAKAVKEAKAGKVEYRVDKQSIVHLGIGRVSFGADKLLANADAFVSNLLANKPATIKGSFIQSVTITTTMGPGIKVDSASL
jgi:large subunit ribosomal protein L1